MAHGDARKGKWKGNWRIECVANTLHTTSERGVSSITNAETHISAASSRLNWRPRRFKWTRPFRRKTKSGFCVCAITFQTQSTCVQTVGRTDCWNDLIGAPRNANAFKKKECKILTRVWEVLEFTYAVRIQAVLVSLPRKLCFAFKLKILVSKYRGADSSLARPTSRCILFYGENISVDASIVIYI